MENLADDLREIGQALIAAGGGFSAAFAALYVGADQANGHHPYRLPLVVSLWILAGGVFLWLIGKGYEVGQRHGTNHSRFLRDKEFDFKVGDQSWEHWIDITNHRRDAAFEMQASDSMSGSHPPFPPDFWPVRWRNESDARTHIGLDRTKRLELAKFDYRAFIGAVRGDLDAPPTHWSFHQAGADDIALPVDSLSDGRYTIFGKLSLHRVSPSAHREFRLFITYSFAPETDDPIPMSVSLRPERAPVGRVKRLRRQLWRNLRGRWASTRKAMSIGPDDNAGWVSGT